MRMLACLLFASFITTCYALKVLAIAEPNIDARPYLQFKNEKDFSGTGGLLQPASNFPLPVSSNLSVGKVSQRTLASNPFTHALFIVGDDAFSRTWLEQNATRLQALEAIGFITNVTDMSVVRELSALAGLPLQPVNIDELATILDIRHYPVVVERGSIWQ